MISAGSYLTQLDDKNRLERTVSGIEASGGTQIACR